MVAAIWASIALVWRAAPRPFVMSTILQAVGGGALALELVLGKRVLERLLRAQPQLHDVLPGLLVFAAITVVVAYAQAVRGEQVALLTECVGRHALSRVLDVAARVELIAYETPGFYDRLDRAKINAVMRPVDVAYGALGLLSNAVAVGGVSVVLITIEPLLLAMSALAYLPGWWIGLRISRMARAYEISQTERDRRRSYFMMTLTGKAEAAEIRAFDLGDPFRREHADLHEAKIADLRSLMRRQLRLELVQTVATTALFTLVLVFLAWSVTSQRMSTATAGTVAVALVLLSQRLQSLLGAASALYEGSLFVDDFTSFVQAAEDIADGERVTRPSAPPFSTLAARDVTFTYPSRTTATLSGVSLEINDGEVVALVGESGSGKTTLARLLAGLYSPDAGQVLWNGADLGHYDIANVRDQVAVVFQDFVHYQLTVAENIAVGRHQHPRTTSRVADAARRAGIHDEIAALDRGFATLLGPQFFGGSDLSVGQWQRLSLARAFFRDASLVILDEPTASLDPRAEARLFADIRRLCQARSVVLISHRLSSVRRADRIYVLDGGRVVEYGDHRSLMRQGGQYAELFTLQARSYRTDAHVLDSNPV